MDAFRNNKEQRPLYAAMRKYGIENFSVELIEETDNPEEREIFWIEQKDSYRNGYNATLGGEGKRILDYDLIVKTYEKYGAIDKTAEQLNISKDSVRHVLKEKGVSITSYQEIMKERYGKKVDMYDLNKNFLYSFNSLNEAAEYLINNHLTRCKKTTIRQHISEVCRGLRKNSSKTLLGIY